MHYESLLRIRDFDAVNLEETLTRELIEPLKEFNFGAAARSIKVRFKIDTDSAESDKKLDAANKAWQMGLEIKAGDIYDLIGLSEPQSGDKKLFNPQVIQQMRLPARDMQSGELDGGGQPGQTDDLRDLFGPLLATIRGDGDDLGSGGGDVGDGGTGGTGGTGGGNPPPALPTQYAKPGNPYRDEGGGRGHLYYDQHVTQKNEGPTYKPEAKSEDSAKQAAGPSDQSIDPNDPEVKRDARDGGKLRYRAETPQPFRYRFATVSPPPGTVGVATSYALHKP
ncbi:MAG: DUF935 family protein, partial [Pirellulales bacterium]|nr:DUF935 family protein [Pirellulales bacterium]